MIGDQWVYLLVGAYLVLGTLGMAWAWWRDSRTIGSGYGADEWEDDIMRGSRR